MTSFGRELKPALPLTLTWTASAATRLARGQYLPSNHPYPHPNQRFFITHPLPTNQYTVGTVGTVGTCRRTQKFTADFILIKRGLNFLYQKSMENPRKKCKK